MAETPPPTQDSTNARWSSPPLTSSFPWWSWRPGISPIRALLLGIPLMLLALVFIATGLYTLITGIIDGVSPSAHHAGAAGIAALLLGLTLIPYPLFLTFGGWHDLREQRHIVSGKIIALRSTAVPIIRQGRSTRPGLSPRLASAWYGLALLPLDPATQATHQQVAVFRLSEDLYRDLREGIIVRIEYTTHLHHVTSLRQC